VIATSGVADVKVEALARHLGITKGSFYWHFRDRQELIEHALELWCRQATVEVIERLDRIQDPERRLRALFSESFGDVVHGPIDALLLARADDPTVGPTVAHCTALRLAFLARAYRDLGLPKQRAAARAQLVYAAYIGRGHLMRMQDAAGSSPRERAVFERELELLLFV